MELMDIEKELASGEAASYLERYDGILVELLARLASARRVGLTPDEFARTEGLDEAVTVARKLLRLQLRG